MTVPVATALAVLILILAMIAAGFAGWWLARLVAWLWETRRGRLTRR